MAERENGPEGVQIGVGTLFSVKHSVEPRIDVVTNPGKNGWFFSTRIFYDKDNKPYCLLDRGGTAGFEDIGEVIGQMTVDELIEAYHYGSERFNREILAVIEPDIRQLASQGQRMLLRR